MNNNSYTNHRHQTMSSDEKIKCIHLFAKMTNYDMTRSMFFKPISSLDINGVDRRASLTINYPNSCKCERCTKQSSNKTTSVFIDNFFLHTFCIDASRGYHWFYDVDSKILFPGKPNSQNTEFTTSNFSWRVGLNPNNIAISLVERVDISVKVLKISDE